MLQVLRNLLSNMKVPLESALGAHQAAHLLQLWLGFQTEDAPPECMGKQQFQPCLCNEHFTKLGSAEKHEDMIQASSTRTTDCTATRTVVMERTVAVHYSKDSSDGTYFI